MASGLSRGSEPIYPLVPGEEISDPVVQAMVLTAIVISFGVSALLISLIYRVYVAHRSVDIEHLYPKFGFFEFGAPQRGLRGGRWYLVVELFNQFERIMQKIHIY